MIKEIIDQWEANKHKLEKWFRENELKEYDSYLKIVRAIFTYVISEYDVIEIDSCEYIMIQSRTYYGYIVTSIGHKGNCKYCKERNNTEQINTSVEHKTVTDTIIIYKYIELE